MFEDISRDEIKRLITFAGRKSLFKDDDVIPELQLKGVLALCRILSGRQYAYLADEVGMGKTYQAIGVIAMLLAEKEDAKVLIIAPNEQVQKNWKSEIENFIKNNIIRNGISIDNGKDISDNNPVEIVSNKNSAKITIVRLTSFSTIARKVSQKDDKISSRQLCDGLKNITGENFETRPHKMYDSQEAGMICGSVFRIMSPAYDLVIVDEAQNIRNENNGTSFFNCWMGLSRHFKHSDDSEYYTKQIKKKNRRNSNKSSSKFLLLSATPAHRGVESLRRQLYYFEDKQNIPKIDHDYLEQFMIRRLRTYNDSSKYVVRSISATDVGVTMDYKQKLFLALVQSRLAQLQGKNNAVFKIGFLETFESYEASADDKKTEDENGEGGKEFENGGSVREDEKGSAKDKAMLKAIAKSYADNLGSAGYPPHPKLNYLESECKKLVKTNLYSHANNVLPDKAIVFVRRLATVDELNRRLNNIYESEIIAHWGKRFGIKNADIKLIKRSFQYRYQKYGSFDTDVSSTEYDDTQEDGVKSELIRWMSLNKSDRQSTYNCVSVFKKTMMRNRANSFLFEENYFRTVHSDESDAKYRKRIERIVYKNSNRESFAQEVNYYINGDISRYIREKKGKRQFNNSYLFGLICYVALHREENPLAEIIKEYFGIKEKAECSQIYVKEKRIIQALYKHTSLWNNYSRKTSTILDRWLKPEQFEKREAIKSLVEKYLKTSEAVLELLYCYCDQKGNKDNLKLCRSIWRTLYLSDCSHGARISEILDEDNAELVYKVLSDEKVTFDYDPAFMNNQQWIVPATGGNKANDAIIKRFNTPFYPDIIVCTDVLKEGINLHLFCNRVYHYGLAWTPGDLEQRVGRVDRFFSRTHRKIMKGEDAHINVVYPYMGKSIDEQQLRKVLGFKLSADPLLDESGVGRKEIDPYTVDQKTIDELAEYVPSKERQTNFPYSGELFWGKDWK